MPLNVVQTRECFTCTSRCFNHMVTCPVLTVTWTVDGFSKSLDSHCMRSDKKTAENRLQDSFFFIFANVRHGMSSYSTCFRYGGGLFSRPRSLYGNVSMASHQDIYRNYAHQWRGFKDVLDHDLYRLDVSSCQRCGRQMDRVEQPAACCARRHTITEHVRVASESSFRTVMNITVADVASCNSGSAYRCHNLLT